VIKPKRLKLAGHVARTGESRDAYRVLVIKREGRRPLERPKRRCEDNIKIELIEVGWGHGQDRSGLGQERWPALVNAVMNLLFP
jgi:hypothetical protein